MKKIIFILSLFIIISSSLTRTINASSNKLAISGKDTVVNDCDNPFTQDEIFIIASIKVLDINNIDITKDLKLKIDNWGRNKTKQGLYKQTYAINYQDKEFIYVLNIYNVVLNNEGNNGGINNSINRTIILQKDELLTIPELIFRIEQNEKIVFKNYTIIEDQYSLNRNNLGDYSFRLKVTNSNNSESNFNYTIRVVGNEESSSNLILYIVIGFLILAIVVFGGLTYYKKYKRGIKNE